MGRCVSCVRRRLAEVGVLCHPFFVRSFILVGLLGVVCPKTVAPSARVCDHQSFLPRVGMPQL